MADELRGLWCCSLSTCNQTGHPAARQVLGQHGVNEGLQEDKQGGWRRAGGGLDAADWDCTAAAGPRGQHSSDVSELGSMCRQRCVTTARIQQQMHFC